MATPLETIRKKAKELQAVKNISYQAALKKAGADYRAGKLSGTKKTTAKKIAGPKKYSLFFGSLGNGTTVSNRLQEEYGDYKKIAHISDNGIVEYYVKSLPTRVKKQIENHAAKDRERYKKTFGKVGKLKEIKKIKHCVVSGIKKPRSTSQIQMAQSLLKTFKARVESSKNTATKNHYKQQYNRVYDVIEHLKKHA